jgi:cobalt-zinc-cadmium efflux system outer membrane protein
MRVTNVRFPRPSLVICLGIFAFMQLVAAQTQRPVRITLDQAIQMAPQHNHALLAARTTILQSEAEEITANLRPNPTFSADYQFRPVFNPSQFNVPSSQLPLPREFDANGSYGLELGGKRCARLLAARDSWPNRRSISLSKT